VPDVHDRTAGVSGTGTEAAGSRQSPAGEQVTLIAAYRGFMRRR
jgi:hypothetical protein